jgi:predicted MPP superfamily phosphohydrolase
MKLFNILVTAAIAASDRQLRFNKDGKFKIVQITDLHYGEGDEKDGQNDAIIEDIMNFEKPDFVVNTGDVISGYMWNGSDPDWAEIHYSKPFNVLTKLGYNWASTAGNHDSQANLSRAEISELDRSFDMSLTQPNAEPELHNSFNYVLPIYDSAGEQIMSRLWFLDSGDVGCLGMDTKYDCIHPNQVNWFR